MFKLIPQLDQSEKIVRIAQTKWGQLLFLAIFTGLASCLDVRGWRTICLVLLGGILLPGKQNWVFLLGTFAAFFGTLKFQFDFLGPLHFRIPPELHIGNAEQLIILLMICLLWFALIFFQGLRGPGRPSLRILIAIFTFDFFTLATFLNPTANKITVLIHAFALTLTHSIWLMLYHLKEETAQVAKSNIFKLGLIVPFWNVFRLPISEGRVFLEKIKAMESAHLAKVRLKGVKLLIWSIMLKFFADLCHFTMFGHYEVWKQLPPIPSMKLDLNQLSIAYINELNLSIPQAWYFVFVTYLYFTLKTTFTINFFVCAARFAGFDLYRASYKPWLARSITDYFRRFHYYYYVCIRNLFFFPILSSLGKISRKSRVFVASFLAIFVGGGIQLHFFNNPASFAGFDLKQAFWMWAPAGVYHLVFGLMIAFSMTKVIETETVKPQPFRWTFANTTQLLFTAVFYLWTLTWITTWGPHWPKANLADHLTYAGRLVGLEL